MASRAKEDYLKAIYECEETSGIARTNQLADKLDVRAATVTEMIQRLSKAPDRPITYQHHQGVRLTPSGRKQALHILRKHRLLETFLHDILELSWDEVHEEAEVLEHHISARVTEAIDRHLGFPKYDPHGEPIPDENGHMAARRQLPLSRVKERCGFSVMSVDPVSGEFLAHLRHLGIGIGTTGSVLSEQAGDGSLSIEIDGDKGGTETIVTKQVAERIFVQIN